MLNKKVWLFFVKVCVIVICWCCFLDKVSGLWVRKFVRLIMLVIFLIFVLILFFGCFCKCRVKEIFCVIFMCGYRV